MKIIIAQFIDNKKEDHETAGDTHCEAEYVYKREDLLFPEMLYRNEQIIFDHGYTLK